MGRMLWHALRTAPSSALLGPAGAGAVLCLRLRLREFVREYKAGSAGRASQQRSVQLFTSLHAHARYLFLACPALLLRLRCINLETLEVTPPSEGHWEGVARRSGAVGCFPMLPSEVRLELREMVGLMTERTADLHRQRYRIVRELDVLLTHLQHATTNIQISASCTEALTERHARYEALLRQLGATHHEEATLMAALQWNSHSMVPLSAAMAACAEGWPYWIDGWSCIAAAVAEGESYTPGG